MLGEVTGLTLSGGDELRVLLSADSDEWEVTLPEGASWVVVRNNEPVMTDAELDAIKRIFQPEIDGGGK